MGLFSSFVDNLRITDDYDEEDYIEDYNEEAVARAPLPSRREMVEEETVSEKRASRRSFGSGSSSTDSYRDRSASSRGTASDRNSKVVPFRGADQMTDMSVSILKPSSFEESQDICDLLLEGKAVIVNLEGFDTDVAQNIMNFVSGAIYAINGKARQISKYTFIFAPENVDVSGEYGEMAAKGFEVPSINKKF